ncbi:MAG: FtsQ-type POTRA domain-containing protein [Cryobacterium sp.]|nr:FtsQ-type POTRA domain-containing protein [Oligoflexia bacterium]
MGVFQSYSDRYRKIWVTVMSVTAMFALFAGIVGVANSDLFTVRVVEVVGLGSAPPPVDDMPSEATNETVVPRTLTPLDANQILEIAKVPTGSTNLFSLKLSGIEQRLLSHPWIKGVTISKRFPQTVAISVVFREPIAILQNSVGALYYLDSDGTAFAPLNLKSNSDFPVLIRFPNEQILPALRFLQAWSLEGLDQKSPVASLEWDAEKGLEVMVTYPLALSPGRVLVDLGRAFESDPEAQLGRLQQVLNYLTSNGIRARQVFADLGKKIVVRIARSS